MSNPTGECRLCGGHGELVEGHIWPGFAYKRYVAELQKGGRFADMMKIDWSNSQYQKYWFCPKCDNELLGRIEKYGAEFSARFEQVATNAYVYNYRFLPFITSISWRVALFHIEQDNIELSEEEIAALRKWKGFLVGSEPRIEPYTQHAFVAFDREEGRGLHRGIGGEVYPAEDLVLSHLGPLFIVGWLDRRRLSAEKEAIWTHSEVSTTGGTIMSITTQEICDAMITPSFFNLLAAREERTEEIIKEFAKRKGLL